MLIQYGFRKNRNCLQAKPVYHGADPARRFTAAPHPSLSRPEATQQEVARVLLKRGAVLRVDVNNRVGSERPK